MPDPSANPPSGSYSSVGGIVIPSSINMQSPAFRSAEQSSEKLPDGSPSGPAGSESVKLQLLALAKCMRGHGVSNFPDPTSSPRSRPGNVMGGDGTYLEISAGSPAIARVQPRGSRLRNVLNHYDAPAHRHSERLHTGLSMI